MRTAVIDLGKDTLDQGGGHGGGLRKETEGAVMPMRINRDHSRGNGDCVRF